MWIELLLFVCFIFSVPQIECPLGAVTNNVVMYTFCCTFPG